MSTLYIVHLFNEV